MKEESKFRLAFTAAGAAAGAILVGGVLLITTGAFDLAFTMAFCAAVYAGGTSQKIFEEVKPALLAERSRW